VARFAFTIFAAACSAFGAVLSRKAFAVAHAAGEFPDAGTTGYQRVLGGILIPAIITLLVSNGVPRTRTAACLRKKPFNVSREKWRRIWPWVLGNSLAGQTLGVTCVQWALEKTPAGIVTAIIAMTPILLLPMTRIVE
jgi:drug/metabolite transporter (DMT)-like permease